MTVKLLGAALIILAGGGFGFMIAKNYKREEWGLQQMILVIEFMQSELQCRLTPLPELCWLVSEQTNGALRDFFSNLALEFSRQMSPDAGCCVEAALAATAGIPVHASKNLKQLGQTLGRFDLIGQLNGLETMKQVCQRELRGFQDQREIQVRSYQTLGFCTGAALVILFI